MMISIEEGHAPRDEHIVRESDVVSSLNLSEDIVLSKKVLDVIWSLEAVDYVIWGGSLAKYRKSIPLSDLDLWVIVSKERLDVEKVLLEKLYNIEDILIKHNTYLPWFGRLITLYSMPDCKFSIDIGIENASLMDTISPGSGWAIISPPLNLTNKLTIPESLLINKPPVDKPEIDRLMEIVSNCVKLRKNIRRGFIYNALEYISRARRELIGLIISDQSNTYERPENRAELYLSREALDRLTHTHPDTLSIYSITKAASHIIQITLDLPCIDQNANIGFALNRIAESLESDTFTIDYKI